MSLKEPTKCPSCGSVSVARFTPPTGTSFVLTTVDREKEPPSFNPTSGLPVNVIGYASCGIATLHIPSTKK